MKTLIIFMAVCLMVIPISAQTVCDLNQDGLYGSPADFIYLMNMYQGSPEDFYACEIPCDLDDDGLEMTIADGSLILFYLNNPYENPPDFSQNPSLDTIKIGSAEAAPEDNLLLPVFLTTVDTLAAFELLIEVDPLYLTIEDFTPNSDLDINCPFTASILHINYTPLLYFGDSTYYHPGTYYLGDMSILVQSDITQPVTTQITFGTCPDNNFYSGLANMTFFVPVLVDGVVTITPVGIEEDEPSLPSTVSIDAYPNPFNMSVKIVVESPVRDVLSIYDILGREIYSFEIDAGINNITWNSLDYDNDQVNAGIYFAKLRRSSGDVTKLLLVK
jgi:hypothetical protein